MSSPTQKLRNYITTLLESEDSFDSTLKSLEIHHHLFLELSLTAQSILEVIESLLNEFQPSADATSYYIDYHNRYKLFQILAHLINNPSNFYHRKHSLNNTQLTNITIQSQKLRECVAPKLHSLIFTLVFPCKSAVQSQYDGIKKICQLWSTQNLFEMNSFVSKTCLKDLNNKSVHILNESEYEEPPNINELFVKTNTNTNHSSTHTPSYIQLPPTFNKSNPNYSQRGYDYNSVYRGGHRFRGNGNGYRGNFRGRGRYTYNNEGFNDSYYYNQTQTQSQTQNMNINPSKSKSKSRSRSRSRSRSKSDSKMKGNTESDEKESVIDVRARQKRERYEAICKGSVIAGVNAYPDIKEFRDEDKMWRLECESKRKEQRRQRITFQLKNANGESMTDQFEKFFDEGMKRWDLVPKCCLDKRIWEWQINLNYNDCSKNYGFGTTQIRNSPHFHKKSKGRE